MWSRYQRGEEPLKVWVTPPDVALGKPWDSPRRAGGRSAGRRLGLAAEAPRPPQMQISRLEDGWSILLSPCLNEWR